MRVAPLINGAPMEKCPHCGYEEFVVSVRFRGSSEYALAFNGGSAENTNLHDGVKYVLGTMARCGSCRKFLGRYTES